MCKPKLESCYLSHHLSHICLQRELLPPSPSCAPFFSCCFPHLMSRCPYSIHLYAGGPGSIGGHRADSGTVWDSHSTVTFFFFYLTWLLPPWIKQVLLVKCSLWQRSNAKEWTSQLRILLEAPELPNPHQGSYLVIFWWDLLNCYQTTNFQQFIVFLFVKRTISFVFLVGTSVFTDVWVTMIRTSLSILLNS